MTETTPTQTEVVPAQGRPLWWSLFAEFFRIGISAFGGGSATVTAMRNMCLRRGWLNETEFLDTVVLSRLTPGISIIAETMLIGKRVGGVRGAVASVVGLLVPAVAVTLALSKIYLLVRSDALAAAPLRAVSGAAAGFSAFLTFEMLRDSVRIGPWLRSLAAVGGFTAVSVLLHNPVITLLAAMAVGIAFPTLILGRTPPDPTTITEPEAGADEH
jgi:chromate transporter